jgi:hypothetical protein
MNDRELALLEKLIDNQKEMAEALNCLAESQYLIAQALMPPIEFGVVEGDMPTLQ